MGLAFLLLLISFGYNDRTEGELTKVYTQWHKKHVRGEWSTYRFIFFRNLHKILWALLAMGFGFVINITLCVGITAIHTLFNYHTLQEREEVLWKPGPRGKQKLFYFCVIVLDFLYEFIDENLNSKWKAGRGFVIVHIILRKNIYKLGFLELPPPMIILYLSW